MRVVIEKNARLLTLTDGARALLRCRIALGRAPEGRKEMEGDGRTPEGVYRVCLVKEAGKYGRSLGLSYPSPEDARQALAKGQIDGRTFEAIRLAHAQNRRPPWGTPLGGEIYIHEGGTAADWTQGCVALEEKDMNVLFSYRNKIDEVEIQP